MKRIAGNVVLGIVGLMVAALGAWAQPDLLERHLSSSEGWQTSGQGNTVQPTEAGAICLVYKLSPDQTFAVIAKDIKSVLPENFEFSFEARKQGANSNLEFKLVDAQGNTFLKKWESPYFPPNTWKKMSLRKSDIQFGWGPNPQAALEQMVRIEIAVSNGAAGDGKLELRSMRMTPLSAAVQKLKAKVTTSSSQENNSGSKLLDGNLNSRWSSEFSDDQWIEFDFLEPKQLVGVVLNWEAAYGKEYEIQVSLDGRNWKKVYATKQGRGGVEDLDFDTESARYMKWIGKKRGTGWGYSLWEVIPKTIEEPQGIGIATPKYILKQDWDFSDRPERQLFIPAEWGQTDSQLWLDGDFADADLYLNGKLLTRISADKKRPVKIGLGSNAHSGQLNRIGLRFPVAGGKTLVRSLLLFPSPGMFRGIKQTLQLSSPMDYYKFMARVYSAGMFPIWLLNQQDYWTVVGQDSGFEESLFSTMGMVGVYQNSFSITPFLYDDRRLLTAADATRTVGLEKNYLPIPSLTWSYPGLEFNQTLFSGTQKNRNVNYLRYRLKNTSSVAWQGKLFLTFRPFEVNPPWQYGGLTKIDALEIQPGNQRVTVNGDKGLFAVSPCSDFGVSTYAQGDIVESLSEGRLPAQKSLSDDSGFGSGAMAYDIQLAAQEEREWLFVIPLEGSLSEVPALDSAGFNQAFEDAKTYWEKRVENFDIQIPEKKIIDVMRSNIAYILINKDGPAIQPGSRCYKNSWIRDGAVMASALLRAGVDPSSVRGFIEWFYKHAKNTGEIPFILNAKTSEMPAFARNWEEWDCQGEFVFCLAEYFRFTKDKILLAEVFPTMLQALEFLKSLRARMMAPQYQGTVLYGILPKSASHEGYIDRPQQSSWDDFWALKGWKDGQELAAALGRKDVLAGMKTEELGLRKNLLRNLARVQKEKKLEYLPASIGLADFDPTSTAISVFPTYEYTFMDRKGLLATMNKYYRETLEPRLQKGVQSSYTPYEIRNINAFNLLGEKDKALGMLRYFLRDMRPNAWNHWAEVVHPDPLAGAYVGDMPHSWIGALYINTVRNLFVYEENNRLVLGSGIDPAWLESGVKISNLRTYFGKIHYTMSEKNGVISAEVTGDAKPEKGFVFCSPYADCEIKNVTLNGKSATLNSDDRVVFNQLPATITWTYK